jgi:predicted amidohydrolase
MKDWDWSARGKHAARLLQRFQPGEVDIVCFPELYPGKPEHLKESAKRLNAYVVCGEITYRNGKFLNGVALLGPSGEPLARHQKAMLMPDEVKFGYQAGQTIDVFETELGRIGLLVCYEFPIAPEASTIQFLKKAQIIFVPSMAHRALLEHWKLFLIARSMDNAVPVVFVNIAGEYRSSGRSYGGGHSSVILPLPKGLRTLEDFLYSPGSRPADHMLLEMSETENTAIASLELQDYDKFRRQMNELRLPLVSGMLRDIAGTAVRDHLLDRSKEN